MNTYHKICTKCNILKPFTEFYTEQKSKDGYRGKCKLCFKDCSKDRYNTNKETIKSQQRDYHVSNREHILLRQRNRYQNNKIKEQTRKKEYRKVNRKKLSEYQKDYLYKKRKTDQLHALRHRIGCLIRNSIKKIGCKKSSKTCEVLGCSYEEFKVHIENQFLEGMSWDNRSEWHLDHIKPVSLGKTEEEIIALNHYTNFQPLWAIDNIKKGNKFV